MGPKGSKRGGPLSGPDAGMIRGREVLPPKVHEQCRGGVQSVGSGLLSLQESHLLSSESAALRGSVSQPEAPGARASRI